MLKEWNIIPEAIKYTTSVLSTFVSLRRGTEGTERQTTELPMNHSCYLYISCSSPQIVDCDLPIESTGSHPYD